jgi:protein-S-isoprenylcysteine O-methyltransferase Ste14
MDTPQMTQAEVAQPSNAARTAVLIYGVAAYAIFQVVFLYLIGFVLDVAVPYSVDRGTTAPVAAAVAIDLALIAAFAIQHTIMARPRFKAWLTRYVPDAAERSTFVLATCVVLVPLYLFWRPIPQVVWEVDSTLFRGLLWALCGAGWLLLLLATFMIDHFDLFGLRQVWIHYRGRQYTPPPFMTRGAYRYLRHPIMLGILVGIWVTPTMTVGHLLLAAGFTVYILLGIRIEERDLVGHLGDAYRRYQATVPSLMPRFTTIGKE